MADDCSHCREELARLTEEINAFAPHFTDLVTDLEAFSGDPIL